MLTISFQLNIKESELFRGVRNSYIYFLPNEADGQDRNGNWVIQSDKSDRHMWGLELAKRTFGEIFTITENKVMVESTAFTFKKLYAKWVLFMVITN